MITFIISLAVLILGYLFYGRFVERVFGPDDRVTPAIAKRDDELVFDEVLKQINN